MSPFLLCEMLVHARIRRASVRPGDRVQLHRNAALAGERTGRLRIVGAADSIERRGPLPAQDTPSDASGQGGPAEGTPDAPDATGGTLGTPDGLDLLDRSEAWQTLKDEQPDHGMAWSTSTKDEIITAIRAGRE